MSSLRDLGEFELIRRLLAVRPMASQGVGANQATSVRASTGPGSAADDMVVGPGDDAAVLRLRPGRELVATTDTLLEGVHFLRDWIDAERLGARLAEANLSDLAAMAAEPRWALVSFGARSDHAADDLVAIQRGMVTALGRHGAVVAGGNLTAVSGDEWLTLTLLGEVETGRAWTRAGARPGDLIAMTGCPGRAGAGAALARTLGPAARAPEWAGSIAAWCGPRARVELARALAPGRHVTAAVDISDGVSSDLAHLCTASGVGARLEAGAWPPDSGLEAAARALGCSADTLRLGASDDYELILAIEPAGREACERIAAGLGVALSIVGAFTGSPGMFEWVGLDGLVKPIEPGGYDHFEQPRPSGGKRAGPGG